MAVDNEPHVYMHPPRRARRGHARNALIAWLDEQERLIRRRGIANEVVEEFDPLHNIPQPQEAEQGRRTLLFRFHANLESSIAAQIQNMIVVNVKSRFMLKLSAVVQLRHNIEDGRTMTFYQDIGTASCLWILIGTTVASSAALQSLRRTRLLDPSPQASRGRLHLWKLSGEIHKVLIRHARSCNGGQTKINCPNTRVRVPASAYERAFYPNDRCSFMSIKWLEWEAKQRGIHIHHARCGHGGERYIFNVPVDGYHPETHTVFQYHGCHWHGCEQCYPAPAEREVVVWQDKQGRLIKRKDAYSLTLQRTQHLRDSGYAVVEKWEHEEPTPWAATRSLEKQTETYLHAIVYDFES